MPTFADAIASARELLKDTDSSNYSHSQANLLQYANDFLDVLATIKPELFHRVAEVSCQPGSPIQEINPAQSLGLVDVLYIKGGGAVTRTSQSTLAASYPSWTSSTPAAAKHWMPVEKSTHLFIVYPPAPSNQVLVCVHIAPPLEYVETAELPVPPVYAPPMSFYIAAMAEARSDSQVSAARSQELLNRALTMVTAGGAVSTVARSREQP